MLTLIAATVNLLYDQEAFTTAAVRFIKTCK